MILEVKVDKRDSCPRYEIGTQYVEQSGRRWWYCEATVYPQKAPSLPHVPADDFLHEYYRLYLWVPEELFREIEGRKPDG